jgi:hypothetical protein
MAWTVGDIALNEKVLGGYVTVAPQRAADSAIVYPIVGFCSSTPPSTLIR